MKLIIVSNRLPVSVDTAQARPRLERGFGGVALGLADYLEKNRKQNPYLWFGWPGAEVLDKDRLLLSKALANRGLMPVFLSGSDRKNFYNGFSNDCLWPLFHSFPELANYRQDYWDGYRQVNERFAEEVEKKYQTGDVIWIHDYHLMLLPKMLRDRLGPKAAIGFFLHIPFPPFEIFRLLPEKWRRGLLLGLLGSDLVGFHNYDYDLYFNGCIQRILGYESNLQQIFTDAGVTKTDTFPMGIDFQKFHGAALLPSVQKQRQKLAEVVNGFKVILSVDRLDYTKGIAKRLRAYALFLEKNRQWQNRVILILVVVPSRIEVPTYQEMKSQIDALVGEINGRFGTLGWTPVIYQFKSLEFDNLAALYGISDVALVTPLRDGMNLVSKEYVASRRDLTGVLVLSEMAGASAELGEAIIINPNHEETIAEALAAALNTPPQSQKMANAFMQERLRRYDLQRWADDFISSLGAAKAASLQISRTEPLSPLAQAKIIKDFKSAKNRLLFLDYDGTLVPYANRPALASPLPEVTRLLRNLGRLPATEVVLISGRDKQALGRWFKKFPGSLVAEHGIWIKEQSGPWKKIKPLKNDWREIILSVLKTYADRLPGAFVEEKDFSLVWHYRLANPFHALLKIKDLTAQLLAMTGNMDVQVLQGQKNIEVRSAGTDKGSAAQIFLARKKYDFILSLGDDITDEDLFKVLPASAVTIKVGRQLSAAKFAADSPRNALKLLEQLL